MRKAITCLILTFVASTTASAQVDNWRFHWRSGAELTYRISHITKVTETTKGKKRTATSKLILLRNWKVTKVDSKGVATLQMTLLSMRNEQVRNNGEVLLFDSKNPKKSAPALRKAMSKFIGRPLLTLRVDAAGRVLDTKSPHLQRFDAEPPFLLVLPETTRKKWQRNCSVVLAPPHGTGEKYPVVQTYTVKSQTPKIITIELETKFTSLPKSLLDRVPLFQKERAGTIVFDRRNGRLQRADLHTEKEITNHQGKGSSYRFVNTYKEEFISNVDR